MAQLIKLENCISRYEDQLFHYVSHFLKVKERRWRIYCKSELEAKNQTVENHLERKMQFRKHLFKHQLIWGTSTPYYQSGNGRAYELDQELFYLLAHFPDTALLLYNPELHLPYQTLKTGAVMVLPDEILCIKPLFGENDSVFEGDNKAVWREVIHSGSHTIENPITDLKRLRKGLSQILKGISQAPAVRLLLIAPNSYIDYSDVLFSGEVLDKRTLPSWLEKLNDRRQSMRHKQLLWAEALLKTSKSVAAGR